MTKDEALKLALDWLEGGNFVYPTELRTAIKEALAQPEPVDYIASIIACRDALDAQPVLASFDCFMETLPQSDRNLLKKLK